MFIFASASEKFADKSKEDTNHFNLTSKKAKYMYDFFGELTHLLFHII